MPSKARPILLALAAVLTLSGCSALTDSLEGSVPTPTPPSIRDLNAVLTGGGMLPLGYIPLRPGENEVKVTGDGFVIASTKAADAKTVECESTGGTKKGKLERFTKPASGTSVSSSTDGPSTRHIIARTPKGWGSGTYQVSCRGASGGLYLGIGAMAD